MHKLTRLRTLVPEEYPPENVIFMRENGIRHFQVPIPPHKEASVVIPPERIAEALNILLDPSQHPVLIHCNKGKVMINLAWRSVSVSDYLASIELDALWLVIGRSMVGRLMRY